MSSLFRKFSLVLLAFLLLVPVFLAAGLGTSRASASSYSIVTLKTTSTSNLSRNIVLSGTTLKQDTTAAQAFTMNDWGDGTVSFRSQSNGLYVTANDTADMTASSTAVRSKELFEKLTNNNGTYSFRSLNNNKYVAAVSSGKLQASATSYTNAQQQFTISDFTPAPSSNEIRLLEITDDGTSELLPLLGSSTDPVFKIDSIRMKQFVAQRDELDGKYDAIYIGKGLYNATLVGKDQNHDTKSIMNDITSLKMNEIKKYYIERGLPVIVYSQANSSSDRSGALYQNTAGLLKTSLANYAGSTTPGTYPFVPASTTSNVIIVGDADKASASAFLTKTDLKNRAAERPRLVLTSKPVDYTEDSNKVYVTGDTLTFNYDVLNVSNISQRSLVANLYIGIDQVLKFDSNNLIVSEPVTASSGNTLTFRLPKGYSGVHYWKLEIVDQGSKLKDIQSGVLRFHDQLTKINVLQVYPSSDSSSLKRDTNLKQQYLKTNDYEITIDTMNIVTFNSTGYTKLNGYYDMLIFGFADSYNSSAAINKAAADAVNSFIGTGQSVMFTHDTVFQGSSNWISYFQDSTGQVSPMTNMGLGAPQTSTTTKKVNEGLLTRFPFDISDSITKVNTTHDQYFGLKLEDPKLVPWYNITGGTRDDDDSWNHYYTYSYGNVTYSGTGHTSTGFPDWEQKLFVNTMFRAFIGSNHAPTLIVDTPTDTAITGKIIPSYNKVLLSYTAQDYDLIDRTLSTSVTFKYRKLVSDPWVQKQVKAAVDSKTGEIITESYDNPLPDGGDLVITVTAQDRSGASTSQTITTKVVKVTANVDLSRTLSANVVNNQIEKNVPFTMTYTITPKSIPYQNGINADDLVIKNFKLDEKFPGNLEILDSDTSPMLLQPTVTGSLTAGYRLTGTLADIAYHKVDNKFVADPISFTVKATPKQNGNYVIQDSNLSFTDFYVNGTQVTKDIQRLLQFQAYAIQAVTKISALSLKDSIIAKGDEAILTPSIAPEDATNKTLTWTSDHPELVTVNSQGVIRGIAEGKAKITATATDGSGLTAVSNVTVVVPGINIAGPATVNIEDMINLEAKLVLANEDLTSLTWELGNGQSYRAELGNGENDLKKTLTGVNAGPVDITVTAKTSKSKIYTKTFTITVIQPIHLTLPSEIHIGKGTEWKRDLWSTALNVSPVSVRDTIQSYTKWTSSDKTVMEIGEGNGVVTGLVEGSASISASYQKSLKTEPVTATTRVVVVDLNVPEQVTVGKGKTLDINSKVSALPADMNYVVKNRLTWSDESGKSFADVNSAGIVTGTAPGIENVTVTYRQFDNGPVVMVKTIQVNVIDLDGPTDAIVAKGKTIDLSKLVNVLPATLKSAVMEHLTWSAEPGKDYVKVDATGIAIGAGTGQQVVTAAYREKTDGPVIAEWKVKLHVITLDISDQVTVEAGKKLDLKPFIHSVDPADIKDKLVWSNNNKVPLVSVSPDGIITAGQQAGTEKIQVSYTPPDSKDVTLTRSITVRVVQLTAQSGKVPIGLTLDVTKLLTITPDPLAQEIKNNLTWADDPSNSVLTVNNQGTATGTRAGTENVTGTYKSLDGSPEIKVTVPIQVVPVDLSLPGSLTLQLNKTFNLADKLGITPTDFSQQIVPYIEWFDSPSNRVIKLLTGGRIEASEAGSEVIKARYTKPVAEENQSEASIIVKVVELTMINSITIGEGMDTDLSDLITINPTTRKSEILNELSWSSQKDSIVSVDRNGIATGVKPGTALVTVTYKPTDGDPIKATITVVVQEVDLGPATTLTVKRGTVVNFMTSDSKLQQQGTFVKSNLHWSIKNNSSTLTDNGVLTAKNSGVATITVAYRKPNSNTDIASRVFTIRIVDMYFEPSSITLDSGESYNLLADNPDSRGKLNLLPAALKNELIPNLTWASVKGNVTVDKGMVTAKDNKGTKDLTDIVTVKLKLSDGTELTSSITVLIRPKSNPNNGGNKY